MAEAMERQADATEALLALAKADQAAMLETETAPQPSVCPGCRVINPVVTQIDAGGGSGPLDQSFFVVETHCCNRRAFAIPVEMMTTLDEDTLREVLAEKGGNHERA